MNSEERIQTLPIWPTTPVITPITAGRTNQNFLVTCGQRRYFARIGYDLPRHRISRVVEARCALFAAQNGVAPYVHYAENGILITDYVDGRTLKIEDANSPTIMDRIAKHLAVLHNLPLPKGIPIFDPIDSTNYYLENISAGKILQKERVIFESIINTAPNLEPNSLVHADLIPENIIDDGKKLWFIDWEYSGIGHPAVDLAFVAMNFELSDHQLDSFVALHGDLNPDLVRALRPVITLREALWCIVQLNTDNAPRGDLVEYTHKCLQRLGIKWRLSRSTIQTS